MNESPRQGGPAELDSDAETAPVPAGSPARDAVEADRPAAEADRAAAEADGRAVEADRSAADVGQSAGGGATRRLLKALAVMGSGTMVSRVLGLARVALAAYVIGNGTAQADIYAVAITVPTALYILFAGGALNSVLVPQLTRAAKHDEDGGEAYTNRITTAFLLILLIVTVTVTLAAPLITRIYSSDRWRSPEMADHYQAMVFLTMITLPEVFFYGAFVVLGQILNARDRFGPMMWAPVASNVIQVLSFVVFLTAWGKTDGEDPFSPAQIWVLGGGYLLGSILQAVVMVIFLRRMGYRFRPRFDLKGTGLGKTFKLAGWAVGFVLVNQVALAVVSRLATSATAGGTGAGLTVYNNAYLVFLLPHSLITVSLATAMVTSASRLAAAGDTAGTAAEVMRTMRLVATALVPAALLLVALGHPIARLLFGNGTGARDAPLIGWTIMAFAAGLVPFTIQHVCLRTYYALERNRDTFFIQVVIAAVQIGLSLAFVLRADRPSTVAPMLALALSLAYLIGLFISFRHLRRFLPELHAAELVRHVVRVTVAIAPGAALAGLLADRLGETPGQTLLGLALGGIVAVGSYLVLGRVFHITELTQMLSRLRRRNRGGSAAAPDAEAGVPPTNDDPTQDESDIATRVQAAIREPLAEDLEPPLDPDAPTTALPTGDDENTDDLGGTVDDEDQHDTAEEVHPIRVRPGRVLGGRYKLEEILVRRTETQTWRATDRVLSRPVLIHLLPPGEDDEQLLTAARRAAVATDSRFLRVLDAQPGDEPLRLTGPGSEHWEPEPEDPVGPYIVCEYAPGVSLEQLLASGPLSALEAAWVVREVADGLAGMHEQGLYHERINPDTVVITATGNVKIVGFLLESELSPLRHHPLIPSTDPERVDIADLGRLLYCTLVSRWPGGHAHGMAAAPVDAEGQLLTPRQVRAGVSPALDTICDRILSPVPRQREEPLHTAQDIVRSLNQVLGTANAAQDLERRLRYPVPVVHMPEDPEHVPDKDFSDFDTAAGLPLAPLADPDAPTGRIPAIRDEEPTDEFAAIREESPSHQWTPSDAPETSYSRSTSYPRSALDEELPGDPPRRWIRWLIALTLIVLFGSLIAVGMRFGQDRAGDGAPPTQWPIVGAIDFDPQGNDRQENPDQVAQAHDGNQETAWETVPYRAAGMNKADGIGVVFDLGEVREVSRADLVLAGYGSSVELRIPEAGAEAAGNLDSIKQSGVFADWRQVQATASPRQPAAASAEREAVTFTTDQPVQTRFVLVVLRELPPPGPPFTGGIAEAVFWG
ncbi:murein biosynthesis integral membrane protein MurJ [Granulicoccus sp. GXG6511]|uniref:murein biosynthesis integral membrane protein MurJ n=1 Tax=Granulicoccus sp. GXG6511 TaxID=3381351 RepID=UPI003D7DB581